jgi:prepilin-type N-terminal cleavage/methylation domain-containing protein
MNKTQDKGFTLVELLIVIVILGILATITVFAVRGITDQGQQSACEADQKTMQTASEAYFAQFGGSTIVVTGDTLPAGMVAKGYTAGATAEDTLVAVELVVETSPNVDVSTAGVVTATNPGDCVGDI